MNDLQKNALIKSMQASNHLDSIEIYLKEMAPYDDQLKKGLQNETKELQKCWQYIYQKAKIELNSKSGYINPLTIFGWAIHYYIETDEEINKEFNLETKKILHQRDMTDDKDKKPIKKLNHKKLSNIVMQDIFSMLAEENQNPDDEIFDEEDEEDYE